ncbi:MAG: MFS transporter [Actinomycetota bacterium]
MAASDDRERRRSLRVMCGIYLGFAMPIAMLGVAWPSIRDELGQSNSALGILATSYGIGRLALSGSGGLQLRRRSFGPAVALAVGALGVASLAVAAATSWPGLLAAVLATGLASGALDSLGGRYIAASGSVGMAGLLAGSYGVGATIGPVVVALGDAWRWAYVLAGVIALAGAAAVARPSLAWPEVADEPAATGPVARPSWRSTAVVASLLLMVAFVGLEVTMGQWTATYLEDARSIDDRIAGLAVSGFWAGATIGRLVLGRVGLGARHLPAVTVGVVLAIGSLAVLPGWSVIAAGVAVGLAVAPFFPVIMATTAERVGVAAAPRVSGWQLVAGNVGATSIPALTGLAVELTDERAPLAVLFATCGLGAIALALARRAGAAAPS